MNPKQTIYFKGDEDVFDGLKNNHSYEYDFKRFVTPNEILYKTEDFIIMLHIAYTSDMQYKENEILLFKTLSSRTERIIFLSSFLPFDKVFAEIPVCEEFSFTQLPCKDKLTIDFNKQCNIEKIKSEAQKPSFASYLQHEIRNGKLSEDILNKYQTAITDNTSEYNKRIEIVIIDDEKHTEICKQMLNARDLSEYKMLNDVPVEIISFDNPDDAVKHMETHRWRFIKLVLIDYKLYDKKRNREYPLSKKKLIDKIRQHNPFIDIYGVSVHDPESSLNQSDLEFQEFRRALNSGYLLNKEDLLNPNKAQATFQRIFVEPIRLKMETPFFSEYKKYVNRDTQSWHVPGHNRGRALSESNFGREFYDFFGKVSFSADHDVPKYFGSIFSSDTTVESIVGKTQNLIAESFNTENTYFVTNGNSSANNIILLSILKPNDKVLVARSCHKSIHYAMVLSGAIPTYLESKYSPKYEIMAPPSVGAIEKELKEAQSLGTPYKLVIVTGCGYEGLVMNVKKINELCKQYDSELFVDEAWYGYSRFHPKYLPTSATYNGVPYVTQSVHKMLSAFRQSAFIHVNSPNIDKDFMKDIYNTFTSTSPQYQLIASMDVAVMQMRMEGYELIDYALERCELFKTDFKNQKLEKIKLVEECDLKEEFAKLDFDFDAEGIFYDPLKISFDISNLGISSKEAFEFLKKNAIIDLVKYTKNCIQILFTIGTATDKTKQALFVSALREMEEKYKNRKGSGKENLKMVVGRPEYTKGNSPRDYFYKKRILVDLSEAVGQKSATLVTPYPPGIPLLLPGEEINQEQIDYIKDVKKIGHISVHGLKDDNIYICDE